MIKTFEFTYLLNLSNLEKKLIEHFKNDLCFRNHKSKYFMKTSTNI